eukprot:COSAG05_NODE_345_length_10977_cov_17.229178_6_plen_153_part_00
MCVLRIIFKRNRKCMGAALDCRENELSITSGPNLVNLGTPLHTRSLSKVAIPRGKNDESTRLWTAGSGFGRKRGVRCCLIHARQVERRCLQLGMQLVQPNLLHRKFTIVYLAQILPLEWSESSILLKFIYRARTHTHTLNTNERANKYACMC